MSGMKEMRRVRISFDFTSTHTRLEEHLGNRKICSCSRYKIYSRYENCFLEDGSYIRRFYNRYPLY